MLVFILILFIIIAAVAIGGAIWVVSRIRRSAQGEKATRKAERLPFRWSYVMLPLAILLLSIILTAYFYHLLPTEVAYHLKPEGSPDKWLSRGAIIAWMLTPQLFLTLVAGGITWGVTKLGIASRQPEGAWIKPERVLLFMGNMVALPQIILAFAILDIFSYNSYQVHILSLWIFALIVMGLGVIILGVFFILAIRQALLATR